MAFSIKPRLSGENSIIMALAAAAFVVAVYNYSLGPMSDAHATAANDPNMQAAIKKAGWKSLGLVSALALLAQDPNIVILGGAAIIGEEVSYRHALMASPDTGRIVVSPDSYLPAGTPANTQSLNSDGGYAGVTAGILEAVAG